MYSWDLFNMYLLIHINYAHEWASVYGFHTSVPCALIKSDPPFSTLPPKPSPISVIYSSTFKSNILPSIENHGIYYVSSLFHLKHAIRFFFLYSLDRHSAGPYVSVNSATIYIDMCISLWHTDFISLSYIPRSGIARSYDTVSVCVNKTRKPKRNTSISSRVTLYSNSTELHKTI